MNDNNAEPRADTPAAAPAAPAASQSPAKKRWFGRGIYGSKDVPIRVLDICIGLMVAAALLLTVFNANFGGFTITFNTGMSDVTVAAQKLKHGQTIARPETPPRPGYTLVGWSAAQDETTAWDFSTPVESDMTLYAVWQPAQVTVRFDLAGGNVDGASVLPDMTVTYSLPYGDLPVPTKEGATFGGWQYSGRIVTASDEVTATGEHTLTALWN